MESRKKKFDQLYEEIEKMPPEGQRTMTFMIRSFDIIKGMCENSGMTDEEINERMKKAKASGDYMLLGLLCAAQVFNYNNT